MDERAALSLLADRLPAAGDDAAVLDGLVLTTDMLHERTDFPSGVTRYTAGWRAVGASLSDVAAMGAAASAAVAVYAAPAFEEGELRAFVDGALEVCEAVGADYVGGDLDSHEEFTVATTALGRVGDPVYRSGASPGEAVCVTGTLGRSGAALRLFEAEQARANELFRFQPRIEAGLAAASHATAMIDSSDGLARSLHQLADANECGFAVEFDRLPVDATVGEVTTDAADERELAVFFGEDFELLFTLPRGALPTVRETSPTPVTRIGTTAEEGVRMDGEPLPDRGYTHGDGSGSEPG